MGCSSVLYAFYFFILHLDLCLVQSWTWQSREQYRTYSHLAHFLNFAPTLPHASHLWLIFINAFTLWWTLYFKSGYSSIILRDIARALAAKKIGHGFDRSIFGDSSIQKAKFLARRSICSSSVKKASPSLSSVFVYEWKRLRTLLSYFYHLQLSVYLFYLFLHFCTSFSFNPFNARYAGSRARRAITCVSPRPIPDIRWILI